MLFIRAENTVGARSAQLRSPHAPVLETPFMISTFVIKAVHHE
jgi:hypothetical protein